MKQTPPTAYGYVPSVIMSTRGRAGHWVALPAADEFDGGAPIGGSELG